MALKSKVFKTVTGYITAERSLLGQNLREIERRLGYQSGRLRKGAFFMLLLETPTIEDSSFELRGYSIVPEHKFKMPSGSDEKSEKKIRKNIVDYWRSENIQLIKVIPIISHDDSLDNDIQYRPGDGVPQWKLTRGFFAKAVAIYGTEEYVKNVPYKRNT